MFCNEAVQFTLLLGQNFTFFLQLHFQIVDLLSFDLYIGLHLGNLLL